MRKRKNEKRVMAAVANAPQGGYFWRCLDQNAEKATATHELHLAARTL
ncbi:MAG: hypothetical protein AB9869_06420 [Verrucomicrobiia bacterium]